MVRPLNKIESANFFPNEKKTPRLPDLQWRPKHIVLLVFFFIFFANWGSSEPVCSRAQCGYIVRVTQKKQVIEPQERSKSVKEAYAILGHQEDLLASFAGVEISHHGGTLAPSNLKVRGLSAARIALDLDGLELSDPATGIFDLNALPLFALSSLTLRPDATDGALGGRLSLHLSDLGSKRGKLSFTLGSFGSGQSEFLTTVKTNPEGELTLGAKIATTKGNFWFEPASIIPDFNRRTLLERKNNDQLRFAGIIRAKQNIFPWALSAMLLGTGHQGGIPGFASSPTRNMRTKVYFLGGAFNAKRPFKSGHLSSRFQARGQNTQTWEKLSPSKMKGFSALSYKIDFDLGFKQLRNRPALVSGAFFSQSKIIEKNFSRLALGGFLLAKRFFRLNPALRVNARVFWHSYSDAGSVFGGHLNAYLFWPKGIVTGLRLAKSARPPTLSELFSPHTIILGNPDLKPEQSYEISLYAKTSKSKNFELSLNSYFGLLQNNILYVNQNAFEIKPINTRGAIRFGGEITSTMSPLPYLRVEGNVALLFSSLLDTGASLPGYPPVSIRLLTCLGFQESHQLVVSAKYHSPKTSNIFGGLKVPSTLMLSVSARMLLSENLVFVLTASNLLNDTSARDIHQFPLPGRDFFATLELTY